MYGNLSRYLNEDKLIKLNKLRRMDLNYNNLDTINWNKLPLCLEFISLRNNQFNFFPFNKILSTFKKLWNIDLRENKLNGFTINWTKDMVLENNKIVDLTNNNLSPEQVNLNKLKLLFAHCTPIKKILFLVRSDHGSFQKLI